MTEITCSSEKPVLTLFFSVTFVTLLLFCISATDSYSDTSNGHKTVFRYRSFTGPRPEWVSPIDHAGDIDDSDIITTYRGNGFLDFIYTEFDGLTEYIRSSNDISTLDDAADDSFTVQAWFLAHDVSGYRTLMSNTENSTGFSLKILGGRLRGFVRFRNGTGHVDQEITGGVIESNVWYYAAFRVSDNGAGYDIRLFLNGTEVASISVPHYEGILQSVERPLVGAEPETEVGPVSHFDGYIYAVSITNYAVSIENFLEGKTVRDGGKYFGKPSYHDYLDETEGTDYRIDTTINKYPDIASHVRRKYFAPFLNDLYIPQGVETDGADLVYVTYYWKNTSDKTKRYPSILAEITTSGDLRRVIQLMDIDGTPFVSHVGGVAYWNGYIYAPGTAGSDSDGTAVFRYRLADARSDYIFNPETFQNPRGDMIPLNADQVFELRDSLAPNTKISYMSISNDFDGSPVLWTGEFDDSEIKHILGFRIDPVTGDVPDVYSYRYRLHRDKVQGVYCYNSTYENMHHFYVTASFGDNPSHIYDVRYNRGIETHAFLRSIFTGPAGLEDMGMTGSDLWTVSESGAKRMQKKSIGPWIELFPFVFVYAPRVWVDRNAPPGGSGKISSPFNTVEEGITNVPYGGTVVIRGDYYPERINTDKKVMLEKWPDGVPMNYVLIGD